jgi:hypothetical protein
MMPTDIANKTPSEFRRFWPDSRRRAVGAPSGGRLTRRAVVDVDPLFLAGFCKSRVQPYAALSLSASPHLVTGIRPVFNQSNALMSCE